MLHIHTNDDYTYVTCITIIDTIILTNYTNDAYLYTISHNNNTVRVWKLELNAGTYRRIQYV
jgi:hypothetical protein